MSMQSVSKSSEKIDSIQPIKKRHSMFRPISDSSKSKVKVNIFDQQLSSNYISNLFLSTADKKRLLKRREIVRSMKFLRKMGEKLREEQNQIAAEIIKQDKRQKKKKKKKQKLKKAQTIEA